MAYFVALDGGGTKTECWIADDERVLGRASAGTVKLMNLDEATATARLQGLVREAAAEARVSLADVSRSCMGLAGSSSETVKLWAERSLREVMGGDVLVCGDVEIAFEAAFQGGTGVLVIAGTGSNVMGRCADGTMVSAGGWGPMLGDEGSGYWIGVEAIKAGLRAQDRGVSTCVLKEVEAFWGLKSQAELVAYAHQRVRPPFGELVPVVVQCAEGGDALAAGVLERAGQELAQQVSLVVSKMHAVGCVLEKPLLVAFTGSVLGKISRVRRSMQEALGGSVNVAQAAIEPLDGAVWLARKIERRA